MVKSNWKLSCVAQRLRFLWSVPNGWNVVFVKGRDPNFEEAEEEYLICTIRNME